LIRNPALALRHEHGGPGRPLRRHTSPASRTTRIVRILGRRRARSRAGLDGKIIFMNLMNHLVAFFVIRSYSTAFAFHFVPNSAFNEITRNKSLQRSLLANSQLKHFPLRPKPHRNCKLHHSQQTPGSLECDFKNFISQCRLRPSNFWHQRRFFARWSLEYEIKYLYVFAELCSRTRSEAFTQCLRYRLERNVENDTNSASYTFLW
jgi:hypothetical protein